jgi:signal transduction histidine kinase/ActR/RegA family two-component response regulator
MPPPSDSAHKVGLVGTGVHLVHAIEALRGVPGVTIAVVADASDRSEGGKLAKSLHLAVVKNAMEVFRTEANLVLEVSGDERQYERLLSIKPPGVEVMSVRGARLLIDLLRKAETAPGGGEASRPATSTDGIHLLEPLTAALQDALSHTGAPGDAAKALLPAVARAAGMEWAALAVPGAGGALSWIVAAPESMALSRLPADKVRQVLGRSEPLWLARPSKGVGIAGVLPLRAGDAVLGLLLVGRSGDSAATAAELLTCQLAAGVVASSLRAAQPSAAPPPVEVIREVPVDREVIREVPVEVVREVIREVPVDREVIREVIKEIPVEVLRDVPVEVVREVEVVKEVAVQIPVEIVKEVVREVSVDREVIREVPVEVVREVIREVPVDREVIREVPVEVVREVIREVPVPVEVIREVPVEVIREVDVVKEIPVQIPVEVVREVIREVPVDREIAREIPVEIIKEVIREVPVDREIVREVPVEVIKEVFVEREVPLPVEVIKEVVRDVPVEVIKEVFVEREVPVPVEVIKEIVRDVPVEIIKEVPVDREVIREVVRDTTRIDEEELRRLRRRLEELETTQDQLATRAGRIPIDEKMQALLNMAGGVGHVFNNVLAGILGRTQLLLKRASREKSKEITSGLHEIESATRMGIDALTRIQEFSRSRPAEPFGPLDLNDIVQRAVEQTRAKWRDEPAGRGATVELITHFGPHSQLIGAEAELLEAVVQLVHNAVDAMPRGGTITIRTGLEAGRATVSVSDTGVGMSETVRRRLFEPFFSTKGETGLGLGLSMVYGVVARHGGDATVDSEEGRGTTVKLRLPTSGEGVSTPLAAAETDRPQVLLVDDDETVRTAVGDMLRGATYSVTLAGSGLEGIAKVREHEGPYDLVITDLGMPDVPGWEVVEAVKQINGTTPVVILSGFDRARATRRARELGVDLVISKPFDIQEFLTTVRGLLAGRKRA